MNPVYGTNLPHYPNGKVSSNGHHFTPGQFTATASEKKGTSELVLFDFDGTITTKDTLIEFVRFYRGHRRYLESMVMLSPILGLYVFKIIPNWKAKQYFLSRHFAGENIEQFNERCLEFSTQVLPSLIRPKALAAIQSYREQNVTMAVVSASAENWVKPFCDQYGLVCLATRLEVKNKSITGKLLGRNCYGDEKVCRIKEQFDVSSFSRIIAYGDSSGDREMLALAHEAHYKPWRP
jgi:HAD superfamily hydrolase (TIGR01490 family)